jgi:hypothetical protein
MGSNPKIRLQTESLWHLRIFLDLEMPRFQRKSAISTVLVVLMVAVIITVAGVGSYYVLQSTNSKSSGSANCSSFILHVEDASTSLAIPGAKVTYGSTTVVTDNAGNAAFAVNGPQTLTISATGYNTDVQSSFTPVGGYIYSFALVKGTSGATTVTTSATSSGMVSCSAIGSVSVSSAISSSTSMTSLSSSSTMTSTTSSSSSTTTNMLETFRGSFKWTTGSGSTFVTMASGSFIITIDLSSGTGTGNGQGYVTATASGSCSGTDSASYTFKLDGGITDPVANNMTLGFGAPTPDNSTMTETCTNPPGSNTYNWSWLSVLPPQVTIHAVPGASVEGCDLIGGCSSYSYQITIL